MRLWNLVEFSEIEESVTVPYTEPVKARGRTPRASTRFPTVKVALGVVALTLTLHVGVAQASRPQFLMPKGEVAAAQSMPQPQVPLAAEFTGKFDEIWTPAVELDLLNTLEHRRVRRDAAARLAEQIDAVYANQQEDFSVEVNRLDRNTVGGIIRPRKRIR
ncbi:MAG: hypothetical protein ACYDD2_10940 [Candidatus Acidiferrales bacterium]